MASIRDELRTTLAIDGLSQYLSALRQAQQGNLQAALTVNDLKDNLRGIAKPIVQVGEVLGIQAGQWAVLATAMYAARSALSQIHQTIRESMQDFEKYNTALFRTSFLFSAMGGSPGVSQIQAFARERSATTGISEEDTLGLLGRARQSGFGPRRAGQIVTLGQDVEASGLTSASNLIQMLNQLMHQEGRGVGSLGAISQIATQLRLDPRQFTGGQQHDLALVITQLTQRVGGLSEIMGRTISGTFNRNQTLLQDAMSRVGGLIEASLVPTIETMNRSLLGFIRAADFYQRPDTGFARMTHILEQVTRWLPGAGYIHPFLAPLARLQDQAAVDQKNKNANHDSQKLDEIAGNTQNMATALFASIFGSASQFTRGALSFRNLQSAIGPSATHGA